MFHNCHVFQQGLGGWNVGNLTTMQAMFYNAKNFSVDLRGWNVSKVSNFHHYGLSSGHANSKFRKSKKEYFHMYG